MRLTGLLELYGAGLRNGLFPMLEKEMRGRTRNWRSPLMLSVYLAVLSGGTLVFLWLMLDRTSHVAPRAGLLLYGTLVFGMILLLALIAATVAATAISGERERRTYDLLLVTRASLAGIVLGKWLASVAYLLFLVTASLPVLAVVYFFGGVPLKSLFLVLLLCLVTGLGYGALGVMFSAIFKRSQTAIVLSLVTVFALFFGTLILAAIVAAGNQTGGVPYRPDPAGSYGIPWYLYLSPTLALPSVLPGGWSGNVFPLAEILTGLLRQFLPEAGRYGIPGISGMYAVKGLAGWAPWARFTLYQVCLSVLCLSVATLAINPLKPWRVWLARRRSSRSTRRCSTG